MDTDQTEQLPDLAAAVEKRIQESDQQGGIRYDDETEMLEELTEKVGEPDLDEMAERAKAYEAKMEAIVGKKNPPNPPVVQQEQAKEISARERSKMKAGLISPAKTSPPPQDKKKKGGKGSKMKLALAMAQTSASTPPIKPMGSIPTNEAGPSAVPESPSAPLVEESTPTVPVAEKGEEKKEADEELWEDNPANRTPRTGDEAFPVPLPPPSVSDNYSRLSAATSMHEELSAELHEITGTLRTVLANIAETNNKIATVERTVHKLEEDKSHYMSSILDRIREVERTLGNKKPETTPASTVAALAKTSPIVATPGTSSPAEKVDVAALLAARKARRNK